MLVDAQMSAEKCILSQPSRTNIVPNPWAKYLLRTCPVSNTNSSVMLVYAEVSMVETMTLRPRAFGHFYSTFLGNRQ